MSQIKVHDLVFKPFLDAATIQQRVRALGDAIASDYEGRKPLFLVMLKGAAIFAADLVRSCNIECELSFVRLSSYKGTASTGEIETQLPPDPEEIRHRDIIVVEDIVDSGHTLSSFLPMLQEMQPRSVAIASLLFKPDMLQHPGITIDYLGFSIPPEFVVGYGLDYDGLGRNLPEIYTLDESGS